MIKRQNAFLLSLFLTFLCVGTAAADSYTVTFETSHFDKTAETSKTTTIDGVEWTTTLEKAMSVQTNGGAVQIGTSSSYGKVTLKASGISGTITSVTFNGRVNSGKSFDYSVSVGGSSWGTNRVSTKASIVATTLSGDGEGDVEITLAPSTSGIYIQSVTIEYTFDYTYAPAFSVASRTFRRPFYVTMQSETEGTSFYYTTDGSEPTTASAPYSAEGVRINGTTTLKAIGVKDDIVSKVTTATYTHDDGYDDYTYVKAASESELVDKGVCLVVSTDGKYAMSYQDTDNQNRKGVVVSFAEDKATLPNTAIATAATSTTEAYELTLEQSDSYWKFYDPLNAGYLYAANGSKQTYNRLNTTSSADETRSLSTISISDGVATVLFQGDVNKHNRFGSDYNVFNAYANSNQNDVTLYRRVETFDITSVGYATIYSIYPYVMPKGVDGAVITAKNSDGTLTLDYRYPAGTVVPAGSALLLRGAQGTYYASVVASTDAVPATDNLLHGSIDDTETTSNAASYFYKLSHDVNGENLGFYWGEDKGEAFVSLGSRCYLAVPQSLTQSAGFAFSDMTTGIHSVASPAAPSSSSSEAYDLSGRRLSPAAAKAKGIHIVGGKKVVVR